MIKVVPDFGLIDTWSPVYMKGHQNLDVCSSFSVERRKRVALFILFQLHFGNQVYFHFTTYNHTLQPYIFQYGKKHSTFQRPNLEAFETQPASYDLFLYFLFWCDLSEGQTKKSGYIVFRCWRKAWFWLSSFNTMVNQEETF